MTRARRLPALIIAALLAPVLVAPVLAPVLAWAQPAAPASHPPSTGNEVAGVTVAGGPSPNVAASYPVNGGSAPAGVIVLKVTFDQPMAPGAWAYGQSAEGAFPHCLAHPRLLRDKKSFALLCTLAPGQTYAMEINPAPRFTSDVGRSAKAYVLKFATTDTETRDMQTALEQAGLKPEDAPIMDWNDDGKGVSQNAPPPAN